MKSFFRSWWAAVNFFESFNLSESSWNTTFWSQYSNFYQWWDRTELFCMMLLSIIFSCSLSIIEIKIIFWWLIENLAESLSKSIFISASQLLYWIIMLLYASFNIFDELILIFLWFDRNAEQSELLFSITEIMNFSEIQDLFLLLLDMLFYSSISREVLHCFINCWKWACSAAEIILKM